MGGLAGGVEVRAEALSRSNGVEKAFRGLAQVCATRQATLFQFPSCQTRGMSVGGAARRARTLGRDRRVARQCNQIPGSVLRRHC